MGHPILLKWWNIFRKKIDSRDCLANAMRQQQLKHPETIRSIQWNQMGKKSSQLY